MNCIICLEPAKHAVECEKCGIILCDECAKSIKKKECPQCRKDLVTKPSLLARRMIGAMPAVCPLGCGMSTTRGDLDAHLAKTCPLQPNKKEDFKGYQQEETKRDDEPKLERKKSLMEKVSELTIDDQKSENYENKAV